MIQLCLLAPVTAPIGEGMVQTDRGSVFASHIIRDTTIRATTKSEGDHEPTPWSPS